ncbi:DUF6069 family protein [Halosolutus halophilus]|uniref:DUF6069 family protein n=1 Tax=Halosolutus halophilus TaxID=1552990 RepID=UPI00223516BF|nr:DUF6069 family protein [Halosolutus halophilus]
MGTTNTRYPVATSASSLVRRTTLGIVVAIAASLLVLGAVTLLGVDLGVSGPDSPFAAGPTVASIVVAGAGAAVAYAVLARVTARPTRNFVALAAVVFVAMLAPVLLVAPSMGVSTAGQTVLVIVHAAVAVPLVAVLIGAVRF